MVITSLLSVQNGNTALHQASLMGHKDTVELLVQKGAQVDSKNNGSIFILRYLGKSLLYLSTIHVVVLYYRLVFPFPLVIITCSVYCNVLQKVKMTETII